MYWRSSPTHHRGLVRRCCRFRPGDDCPRKQDEQLSQRYAIVVRRCGLVVRASGSQAKHDGFESWSRHVISLGKEFTHICSGQLSLLPTGWKMSTSFGWGFKKVLCATAGTVA